MKVEREGKFYIVKDDSGLVVFKSTNASEAIQYAIDYGCEHEKKAAA